MLESILNIDIELLIYLNNLGTTQWDGFWMFITNKFSAIPLYVLLLFFTYKKLGLKKTIAVVLFIALLIAVSDQTSQLFKYGFRRLRPCHNEDIQGLIRIVKESCGGKFSYFSAHAANSMAIAVFFGKLLKDKFKFLPIILLFWAIMVGFSRIYIGVHFPLDVLTGFFFGIVYASIIYFLMKLFFKKVI